LSLPHLREALLNALEKEVSPYRGELVTLILPAFLNIKLNFVSQHPSGLLAPKKEEGKENGKVRESGCQRVTSVLPVGGR
jgi:hypothetical protein